MDDEEDIDRQVDQLYLDPVTGELRYNPELQVPMNQEVREQEVVVPPAALKCTVCKLNGTDLAFDGEYRLARHFQIFHQDIRFKCYLCRSIFTSQVLLFAHLRGHGVLQPDKKSVGLFSLRTLTRVCFLMETQDRPNLVRTEMKISD